MAHKIQLVHEHASPKTLNVFRIVVFGFWIVHILKDRFENFQYLPNAILYYTGFLIRFLPQECKDALLTPAFLYSLKYFLIAVCVLCLFKVCFHWTGLTASLLITVYHGLMRSFGHMDHIELSLMYATYMLSLFGWADWFWQKTKPKEEIPKVNLNSVPLVMTLMFFCFTYSFIGIYRLIRGGPELVISNTMILWMAERIDLSVPLISRIWDVILNNDWAQNLLNVGLVISTFVEAGAILVFVSRWYRYFFVGTMFVMHALNFVLLDILFLESMFILTLFFDWTPLIKRWGRDKG